MLGDQIEADLKTALKARDVVKVETLRMLKAAVHNFLIEKRKEKAEENEIIALIQKQIKLREDSIESFKKGGRAALVEKETREKTILQSYLPAPLSDQELRTLVQGAIRDTGARSQVDIGKVMKEAIAKAQNRADAARISQVARELLS